MRIEMRRSTAARAVPILLGMLLLGGCAAGASEGEAPAAPKAAPASEAPSGSGDTDAAVAPAALGEALVTIGGREFGFVLELCMVSAEREALLEGPGGETGTDVPSFLGGDVPQTGPDARGAIRIAIGATDAYESMDEMLAFGAPAGGDFSFVEDGNGYIVTGPAWDGNGNDLGIATMRFTCG